MLLSKASSRPASDAEVTSRVVAVTYFVVTVIDCWAERSSRSRKFVSSPEQAPDPLYFQFLSRKFHKRD